jgi:O-antigen ligase/polysaccharide polymerase Wzy-like membrane protein
VRALAWPRNPREAALLPFAAPAAALAVVLAWAAHDGGYPTTSWYPGGVFLALLLALQLTAGPGRLGRDSRTLAFAALALLGLFEILSIVWANDRGAAWDSGNRTLVYALVLAIFATAPLPARGRENLALLLAGALAAVALVTLFSAADHPQSDFLFSRLKSPTGYPNATAALFLIPFWPAVALAAEPARKPWARAAFVGFAAALLAAAIVPESRGAVYVFPATAVLLLLVVPRRIRTGVALAVASAPAAVLIHTLNGPYASDTLTARSDATRHAAYAVIAAGAVAAVVGGALALLDRRFDPKPPSWYRYVRIAGLSAAVATAVTLAVIAHPGRVAHRAWTSFHDTTASGGVGGTRLFGNLGSNRYDFWRVSLDIARDHPVAGIGADNFSEAYLRLRHSDEQPQYPHSVVMGLLSETGALGTILFTVFLAGAGVAVWRVRRDPTRAALASGGAAACVYWLAHGSVDWLWEFPALGGVSLVFLGLAVAGHSPSAGRARPVRLAAAALAVAAALSFIPPWLSAHQVDRATAVWQTDPGLAFALLHQAARLNPVSDDSPVTELTIAAQLGDSRRMAASARSAIARDGDNWYSHLQLAIALEQVGRWREARDQVLIARGLNPREPLVDTVAASARTRHKLRPDTINLAVLEHDRRLDPQG